VFPGERRNDAVECAAVGEQRVQQYEVAPCAGLRDVDRDAVYFDDLSLQPSALSGQLEPSSASADC
jgi:hypothetical protein